ncbi:MAG: hypothetical protein MMC33_008101 [Icmadophila ericetorum]|nr:hypothetical protein [Icmadophila ericetorum]
MPPQTSTPVAANVLGTIGTFFWCVQLVPQIYHNWRNKKTDGLPGLMMFLFALSTPPFGVYAVVQTLIYHNGWKTWKATLLALSIAITFAGVEVGLVFTLRGLYDTGTEYPMVIVGVVASIILAAGLVPPYIEIWRRSGRVIGINWMFLCMDWLGAFLSLMAVVAQTTFDPLGAVLFIIVATLESGIFLLHVIWLLRTVGLRKKAKKLGLNFDDLPEAQRFQWPRSELDKENAAFRSENTLCDSPGEDLEKGTLAENLALSRSDSQETRLNLNTSTFGTFNFAFDSSNETSDRRRRQSFPQGVLPDDFSQGSDADTLGGSEGDASDSGSDTEDEGEDAPDQTSKPHKEKEVEAIEGKESEQTTGPDCPAENLSEISQQSPTTATQRPNTSEEVSFPETAHIEKSSRL